MLIESMRDIGYSLETASADIVDNSITAGAQNQNLCGYEDQAVQALASWTMVVGMSESELSRAMRPESKPS